MGTGIRGGRAVRRLLSLLTGVAVLMVGLVVVGAGTAGTAAAAVPPGFQDAPVLTGLTAPTTVQFAPDGRIFVAEKSGLIKVFHGLGDRSPTIFADLRTEVHNFWDRGLLGLALDPQFSSGRPYVYVLYTHDAAIGGTAPRWGTAGATSDGCPNPPGAMGTGCVVSGHLSKLTANGDVMSGSEQVLVEGWCQQFPSHSMGTVAFGADGKLYASAGDGASFVYEDHGQTGNNVCGDPAGQGGALRAQSLRNGGQPTVLNGSVIRVDPDTGRGSATNALAGNPNPNARRIVAEGLRNPFRFTFRPGTNEIWAGDVGWNTWEEINRVTNPTAPPTNFGWPCWEGPAVQDSYSVEPMCQSLPASAVTQPYFTYNHANHVAPGDNCAPGSSSITGMAFHTRGNYPASYDGALFFADYSRNCIWVMPKGANGLPDPAQVRGFISGAASPVSLVTGPGGDLYYTDLRGGALHRITYTAGNNPPVASVRSSAINGRSPLTVTLDASGSSDPDPGDQLSYSWDLNGDGVFGDAAGVTASTTFTTPGNHSVAVKVTDNAGASSIATLTIAVGPGAPVVTIAEPTTPTHWAAGDPIPFQGSAIDPTDGVLPASALSWSATIQHCPSNCHTHPLQDFSGVDHGSFTAPDHDYPSYVNLSLTATDSLGLTTTKTVRLDPATVELTFTSHPAGLRIAVGAVTGITPFTRTVIANSSNSITALAPQTQGGRAYSFGSWSDAGAQGHDIVAGPAGAAPQTFTATYADIGPAGPTPQLTITPPSLTFTQPIGTTSAPQAVILTNTGTGDLHVAGVSTDNPSFTVSAPAGCLTVPAGANCSIPVTFRPTAAGAVSATLTLRDDDGGVAAGTSTQTVALTGTAADPIAAKHAALGGDGGLLGVAVGGEYPVPGGTAQNYTAGRIYNSPASGAHEVHGAILTHYLQLGGPAGMLGLPTSDEQNTANNAGRYNTFTAGDMYWSLTAGAHEIHGAIRIEYFAVGGPAGILGFPTTDETPTPDRIGRYNHFTGTGGSSIYWTPATGAHEIQGAIRARWASLGWERSRLGYPTSDEYAILGGRRNDFHTSNITWTRQTNTTTVTIR